MTVVNCAYIGGLTGIVKRRGRGTPTVLLSSLVAGAVFGVARSSRRWPSSRGCAHLIFESMTANINGLAAVIARIPDMQGVADQLKRDFATALDYWPYLFLGSSVLVDHRGQSHRLVGAVAGDDATARHSRRPQAGVLDRHRVRSHRCLRGCTTSVPLPQRRPRRARPGVAERRARRASRRHRRQRIRARPR